MRRKKKAKPESAKDMSRNKPMNENLDKVLVASDEQAADRFFHARILPEELEAVSKRRRVARARTAADQPPGEPAVGDPENPAKDLVGLALSGGGVRSAMFNLGLLHALYNERAIRHIDVMATVSGGTYVGTYLSTLAVGREDFFDRTNHPLVLDPHFRPTKDVLAFAYAGRYLFKPLQFASRYLQGLVLTNWVLLSLLMFAAGTVALLWRLLDLPAVRGWTALVGLGTDLDAAFLPAIAAGVLWAAAGALRWLIHGVFRVPRAHLLDGLRTGLFGLSIACVGIGGAVALGNADLGLGDALQRTFGVESFRGQAYLRWPLAVLLVLLILPLARAGGPAKSGQMSSRWRRVAWELCLWAATVGLALAWVAWFAQEDFSLHAATRPPVVEPADVKDWDGFAQWASKVADGRALSPALADPLRKAAAAVAGKDAEFSRTESAVLGDAGTERTTKSLPAIWWRFAVKLSEGRPGFAALRRFAESDADPDRVSLAKEIDGLLAEPALHKELERQVVDARKSNGETVADLDAVIAQLADRPARTDEKRSDIDDMRDAASTAKQIREARRTGASRAVLDRIAEGPWARGYGRALLRIAQPDSIKPLRFVSTPLVVPYDEMERLYWTLGAAISAAFALFLVNMNAAASVFWFYKARLRDTFVAASNAAERMGTGDRKLAELITTDKGAPYHVIVASDSKIFGRSDKDAERHRFFSFSHLFVGSPWPRIGYARTGAYLGGSVRVSEAMALSGAAVSPAAVPDWRLTFALFALNLRLGQWMPRPSWGTKQVDGRTVNASPALTATGRDVLGAQWLRATLSRDNDRLTPNHLFVADGGYRENLGIEQLLLRRCKVVVVSDAGTDADGASDNLANAIHLARVDLGVRIVNFDPDKPVNWDLPLDVSALTRGAEYSASHLALGLILYPPVDPARPTPNDVGVLIYLKSSLTGDEDVDVRFHRRASPAFPYDTTLEQFYDERRVEAYRELGYHIGLQGGVRLKEVLTRLRAAQNAWPPAPPQARHMESPPPPSDSLPYSRAGLTK